MIMMVRIMTLEPETIILMVVMTLSQATSNGGDSNSSEYGDSGSKGEQGSKDEEGSHEAMLFMSGSRGGTS